MRHVLAAAGVTLVLALGLVLVLAGGDEDVVVEPAETAGTSTEAEPETAPPSPAKDNQRGDDTAEIERAVALHIEAAERGEVDGRGLPTSDELTIDRILLFGRGRPIATAFLVGGARVELRKEGGRWRVVRARPGRIPAPTPPSNGP